MLAERWRIRLFLLILIGVVVLILGHLLEKVSVNTLRQRTHQLKGERDFFVAQNYEKRRKFAELCDPRRIEKIAEGRGFIYPTPNQMVALSLGDKCMFKAAIRQSGEFGKKVERLLFPGAQAEMGRR